MKVRMAACAAAADQTRTRIGSIAPAVHFRPCLSEVAGVGVTILAEVRLPLTQQFAMLAAVSRVTDHAVFLNRRMFPNERAALVGVTFVTELVVALAANHPVRSHAMDIVTVIATDFALKDGVVRLLVDLRLDVFVTGKAGIRSRLGAAFLVDVVTGTAGNFFLPVLADVPHCELGILVVTGQALLGLIFSACGRFLAEHDDRLFFVVAHVLLAGSVTGFAAVFTALDLRERFAVMAAGHEALYRVFVAGLAFINRPLVNGRKSSGRQPSTGDHHHQQCTQCFHRVPLSFKRCCLLH